MPEETKLERRFGRSLARATTPRGAAVIIASVSTAMTLAAGLLMTVVDRKTFPTVGAGLWWAVQTVTTVGYGDHVPESAAGQIIAALVMLFGIGFLTVVTAAITSTFVSRSYRDLAPSDVENQAAEQLRQIDHRLERIEAALTDSS